MDEWMYKEAVRDTANAKNITGRYTVHLYFSSPEWHFGPSTGYRILQRIALKGRQDAATGTVRTHAGTAARRQISAHRTLRLRVLLRRPAAGIAG